MKKQKIDITLPINQFRHIDTCDTKVFIFLHVLKFLVFFYNFHKFFYQLAFYVLYTYLQIQHTQQRHFNLFQYHYYREVELFFVNFFSFFFFFFFFFSFFLFLFQGPPATLFREVFTQFDLHSF